MSGVASKLSRLPRSRSFSEPRSGHLLDRSPGHLNSSLQRFNSVRYLHGSILNPRAPKIRHLNASHSLLIELDKHIAKVQELEHTVMELELQLQIREAQKAVESTLKPLPDLIENRLKRSVITEEERTAFQNRLLAARKKAEQLAIKTTRQEANILRSWHSKKLKEVLDDLSSPQRTEVELKLLAAPSEVDEDENRIFSCLNSLVEIANEPPELHNNYIEKLHELITERDNLKQFLEGLRTKLNRAVLTTDECLDSLTNIENSKTALSLEIQSSKYYLGSILRRQNNNSMWIYGPNPIFSAEKGLEISASFQNHFVQEMLKKMDLSQIHAEKNLVVATNLVDKYKQKLHTTTERLDSVESAIEAEVEVINKLSPVSPPIPVNQLVGAPKPQHTTAVHTTCMKE